MKIIKHCSQTFPSTATGALVGMDVDGSLEITNTFPFPVVEVPAESHFDNAAPNPAAAAPRAKANAAYSAEYIRMLREVNTDANNVGWYTSANMGNFVNMNVIENQFYYQSQMNERTVALVHDVSRSAQGSLSLRAFRLSAKFMAAFKENKFTSEEYVESPTHRICHAKSTNGILTSPVVSKSPTCATPTSSRNCPSSSTTRT